MQPPAQHDSPILLTSGTSGSTGETSSGTSGQTSSGASGQTSSGTSGTSSSATDTYTSQANLNLTLYNFGKREGTVQAARETVDATREDFSTTTQDIVLSVKQAYYTYLGTQALVRVRQDTVRNRELLVRQAQGFYEVGTRARIDVARAAEAEIQPPATR